MRVCGFKKSRPKATKEVKLLVMKSVLFIVRSKYMCNELEIAELDFKRLEDKTVELKWGDGKSWVANPRNTKTGRTWQEVIYILHERWYRGPPHYTRTVRTYKSAC